MAEEENKSTEASQPTESTSIVEAGAVSGWLTENGFDHDILERDHLNVEVIRVESEFLIPISTALYAYEIGRAHV